MSVSVTKRSMARVCDRWLAGVPGSNPVRGMAVWFVCCTLKTKAHTRTGSQGKEIGTESLQKENKRRNSEKNNPGGGEIFCTRPDRPWVPPSLLYIGYRLSPPGVKWPGRGANHPPSSSAEVKERVELYLYSSSGPSWPVLGRTLLLGAYLTGFFAFVI
jgi:hypothetical protein